MTLKIIMTLLTALGILGAVLISAPQREPGAAAPLVPASVAAKNPAATPRPTRTPWPTSTPLPTPTPASRPNFNFTAQQTEVSLGQAIPLVLTLFNPTSNKNYLFDAILKAPDNTRFTESSVGCKSNVCQYRQEIAPGESREFLLAIQADQPGQYEVTGAVTWDPEITYLKTQDETPRVTFNVKPPQKPKFDLHVNQTGGVHIGQQIAVTLTAQNLLNQVPLHLDLTLSAPDGWAIVNSDPAEACTPGLCSGYYEVAAGDERHIKITMTPNQAGKPQITAEVQWHFANEREPQSETLDQQVIVLSSPPTPVPQAVPAEPVSVVPAQPPPQPPRQYYPPTSSGNASNQLEWWEWTIAGLFLIGGGIGLIFLAILGIRFGIRALDRKRRAASVKP